MKQLENVTDLTLQYVTVVENIHLEIPSEQVGGVLAWGSSEVTVLSTIPEEAFFTTTTTVQGEEGSVGSLGYL